MLYTRDGNDTLKRIIRRTLSEDEGNKLGPSAKLASPQKIYRDQYLPRESIDKWVNNILDNMLMEVLNGSKAEENPYVGRWKNMKDNITKEMWDIFDETGIFLALCCHGFSLIVDMVQSGELAKYPLAVVKKLWDVFGNGLAGWFDINCKFKKHALEEFPWCTCKGTQPHLPSRLLNKTLPGKMLVKKKKLLVKRGIMCEKITDMLYEWRMEWVWAAKYGDKLA
ncbi:hypothetical protein SERLADRAFT_404805 [Serpula lacrymans var. lacrymans S7.9]|uniref:Uncharacterized protein n=1 Tax=Serpula lacrymans var. lacrymans (strain S7.9) TaxID=578457 RepID=F8NF75_SERL9|nr:uncharacterized protein SERLADRAFT_404805 [Serpula lacrymans var. lacrymans S7.9]EGO30789.1 hypothetical protein SERLADRAFT_404805 [Serpula lacrymans var. lacrymans S7.9]